MATDVKKHTSPAAGETPSRAAIAAAILSINDIVPVANTTEANIVAAAVAAAGQDLATTPLFVSRADARGLHRIEYTYNGTVWLPFSGVLTFADRTAADAWAAANSGLLVAGDRGVVNGADARWSGTAWIIDDETATPTLAAGWNAPSTNVVTRRAGIAVATFNASRSSDSAVDAVAVTIPAGYRGGRNAYFQAWGLLGAAATIQCWYDASTHQIKVRQTVLSAQSIALTAAWPITA